MKPIRPHVDPVIVEFRLAVEHRRHATPVLDCPLCFQAALRFGADPRPRVTYASTTILLNPAPFVTPAA